ncbi:MAG: hypothetical protein A3K05_04065 [Candidatus Doudnabacteria bacterium RIFCSPHIGHO2_01_48_18]|nr:MAG: hypothetical protein A3K05_04065 [Candidatus Doudnabacteria bacterium RIFCSPHIGHO2_01_48_18]OGF00570.1 MAG: hypothetical protein A3G07_04955 [Candidatus Doudnabacteria bacterium RIFCSPLOWO2_12_FULL_47_12]
MSLIPLETIERRIFLIRGHKVMIDRDLAELYGVPTKRLNEQVRRNIKRFPADFMLQLTAEETRLLRSQTATLKKAGRGQHRKYFPYVFTEQGVAMLASALNSERAIQVNISIVRTFVRLREMLATHKDLAAKIEAMEKKYNSHFKTIFEAIQELMGPEPVPPSRQIGFRTQMRRPGITEVLRFRFGTSNLKSQNVISNSPRRERDSSTRLAS